MLVLNLALASFMAGLIWFVQIVHYPLFLHAGSEAWCSYHVRHTRQTTWVVAPAMLAELAAAVALVAMPNPARPLFAWLALALLVVVWLSTFFWQVPLHNKLSAGCNPRLIRELCLGNWLRTFAWSLRAVVLAVAVVAQDANWPSS